MTRVGSEADAAALALVGQACHPGMCLGEVRSKVYDIPGKYLSANQAWNHAATRSTAAPPEGFSGPVWFSSANPDGHVAHRMADGSIVSINGSVWSHFANVSAMHAFGSYKGHAFDLNDVTVGHVPDLPPAVPTAVVPRSGKVVDMFLIRNNATGDIYLVAPYSMTHITDQHMADLLALELGTWRDCLPVDIQTYKNAIIGNITALGGSFHVPSFPAAA